MNAAELQREGEYISVSKCNITHIIEPRHGIYNNVTFCHE